MIISKTPFRISFFGGGTDFPDFYKEYGGKVLSTTIDKYAYVNVRNLPHFFEYKNEIIYSKIEQVKNIDNINHPMVKNTLKHMGVDNIKITYDADLPARSGLGTSSSFAVGLINSLNNLSENKYNLDSYEYRKKIADSAIYVERVLCNEAGGIQDQIAAAFGGLNIINMGKNINVSDDALYNYEVEKVNVDNDTKENLSNNLLLFFTGIKRDSFKVQNDTVKNINNKYENLLEMNRLVDVAKNHLRKNELNEFGKLLDYAWQLKKSLSDSISLNIVDEIYEAGMSAGALGGKLLGAGGGGFILFYVEDKYKNNVRDSLKNLMEVEFDFEDGGSKIIFDNE